MGEISLGRHKMVANEKIVKLSNKDKQDALNTVVSFSKQLKETQQEGV